jgi:hypothetical protein
MRIKLIGIFLLLIAVAVGVLGFVQSQGPAANAVNAQNADHSQSSNLQPQDGPGVINGKDNPELIPDHVAYAMLFRLIANRPEESAQRSIRSYVKQIFHCRDCESRLHPGQAVAEPAGDNPDIDALIATAEEHHRRITVLDNEAAKIKGRSWPEPAPEVMAKLTELQMGNEALTAEIAASLPTRLSAEGMQQLRNFIIEHVKPAIKIMPGPQPPPDSDYYRESPPAGSAPPQISHHNH